MSRLKLALLTCSVALFISCHRQTTVNGSVFIVTKGKENIKLGLVQVSAIPEQAVLKYLQRLQEVAAKRASGITMAYYLSYPDMAKMLIFDDLPAELAVATTDADGKFTMRLPANTPIVLAAHSSRSAGNTTEEYYWLCRFSVSSSGNTILLSNQNLLSDNSVPELLLAGRIPEQ
jgi:hypothetical protein